MTTPTWKEERALWKRGHLLVAGVDEAGRGPLAGPVVASAVCVHPNAKVKIKNLRDSKLLSASQREHVWEIVTRHSEIQWATAEIGEGLIDEINIYQATRLAMKQAVEHLQLKLKGNLDFVLLDGVTLLDLPVAQKAVPHGDARIASCAAASIIAKVTRDRLMAQYHELYPEYGFNRHKGYATPLHVKALAQYGPCSIHRKSFHPITEYAE